MNIFNRVVLVLILLAKISLAVLLLVFPYQALQTAITVLEGLHEYLVQAQGAFLWYVVVVGAGLILFLALLYMELRRPRKKSALIRTASGGKARIGVDSIQQSLEYRIEELPGIRDVRPRIISYGKDVRVLVDLHTSPTVNVPTVVQQIVDLAQEIVEAQLGLKIRGKVEINVAHEPFPRGTLAPGVSSAPAAEPRADRALVQAPPPPAPVSAPPLDPKIVPAENEFDLRPGDLGMPDKPPKPSDG